ncbi:MAG: hypothetical protein U5K33_09990 [Halofilum sp. (in: g-proteobacteria)]|nr:hypothetical protein [Halofilum sp. (in: g-proteobacteria)]
MNAPNKWVCMPGLILAAAGCTTIPDESALTRLDRHEVHDAVHRNTTTQIYHYGRWAEYHASDSVSYARAWGSWGREDVVSEHVTRDSGKMCHTYTGPYEWAGPDHEFCGFLYRDADGNYYYKATKDTYNASNVGKIMEMEIKPGDPYELAE